MEAEIKAARERAIVPLEARMKQFKDMLLERGVRKYSCINMNIEHFFPLLMTTKLNWNKSYVQGC